MAKHKYSIALFLLSIVGVFWITSTVLSSIRINTTEIDFQIRPQFDAPQVSKCIVDILDDKDGGQIRLRLWFEQGSGAVLIYGPGHLSRVGSKVSVAAAKEVDPYIEFTDDGKSVGTFYVNSTDTPSYIDQTFTGPMLRKASQANQIRFAIDGVSSSVVLTVQGLDWMTVEDLYPAPTSRNLPDRMFYKLNGHPDFPKLKTAYFTVQDNAHRLSRDRFVFLAGILAGVLCSVIATFVCKVVEAFESRTDRSIPNGHQPNSGIERTC